MAYHSVIEQYGYKFVKDLLDILLIEKKVNSTKMRNIMIKHGIIKRTTKIIQPCSYHRNGYYHIYARNGRNTIIFNLKLHEIEVQQIINELHKIEEEQNN